MWVVAVSVYAGLKVLSLAGATGSPRPRTSWPRTAGYLMLWPGMDPTPFLTRTAKSTATTPIHQWNLAAWRIALGLILIYLAAPLTLSHSDLLAGWLGMIGLLLMLHCGLFDFLSLAWRRAGINALPLMNHPLHATSLGDFWGHRWNRAFRDVAHRFLFRPLLRPLGAAGATMAAFFFSGVVHDVVISLPAGGGYGLPTIYFLLQGAGLLVERSRLGESFGLRRGFRGRLFCAAVTIAPLGLLFHPPFVREIILPMLRAMGAL